MAGPRQRHSMVGVTEPQVSSSSHCLYKISRGCPLLISSTECIDYRGATTGARRIARRAWPGVKP